MFPFGSSKTGQGNATDLEEFSLDRYAPMMHIMGDDDLNFLKSQSGYRPEIGKKFSRERRHIFRLYLNELASDFHRLHAQARIMAATLPAEHSSLVGILIRQKLRFHFEMSAIQLRLTLHLGEIDAPWFGSSHRVHACGTWPALSTIHCLKTAGTFTNNGALPALPPISQTAFPPP